MYAFNLTSRDRRKGWRRVCTFLADRSGVTVVEFSILIIPFMLLVGGIIEDGLAYFRAAQLQNVAENASRKLRVSAVASGTTPKQFQDAYVCTSGSGSRSPGTLSSMFDCSKVVVVISSAATWAASSASVSVSAATLQTLASAGTSTAATALPAPDQIGTVIIIYKAPPIFLNLKTVLGKFSKDSTTYYPYGKAAFRVEPAS
ncbi:MAG: TadE/TadG family type IV pilus assembly protein [Methylocystis sp.]|uniref:TadE/TadG family type IV pilus assembly protein n=1 Tax=Methylocystis sp. TaxID=1911079 RepID=UPI003DA5DDFF